MEKEWAEFAGILLGDGMLGIYHTQATNRIKIVYRIKVTLDSREVQYGEYVQKLMTTLFGKEPKIRMVPGVHVQNILLSGKRYTDVLQNKGFKLSPKWNRAVIPEQFLTPEFDHLVLRGYFDTDGSVVITDNNGTRYPRLEMKISPSPMQQQFIDILRRRKFHFGIYKIGKGKVRIQMNGMKQLRKWCDEIGFSNSRHAEKAQSCFVV